VWFKRMSMPYVGKRGKSDAIDMGIVCVVDLPPPRYESHQFGVQRNAVQIRNKLLVLSLRETMTLRSL